MIRIRILECIAYLSCRRYKSVLLVACLLTVLAWLPPLLVGMHKAFDISKMLPQEIPAAQAFTRAITDFDSADEAVVVFRLNGTDEDLRIAGKVADLAADELLKCDEVKNAFCRKFRPEEKDFFVKEELPRRGLLLLSESSLETIREDLEPDRIRRSVARTARRLGSSAVKGDKLQEMIALDALGIGGVIQRSVNKVSEKLQSGDADGYLVNDAKTMLLLVVHPKYPAQSISFSERVMELVREKTEAAADKLMPPAARKAMLIEYGGGYEIACRYESRVNTALLYTLLTSMLGVICLFGYCFRRPGVLLYIGVPLVMIVSWTIGLGWIIFGQLNIVSCAFAAVLVGLGVDYAVHIYNRYIEERTQGVGVEESFRVSLTSTGWAVFIGMATTALAFLALNATRFTQLSQFGALAGIGIALSVPGMLFVLPALITLRNAYAPEHARTLCPTHFHLPWLAGVIDRHKKTVLLAGLLFAAACGAKLLLQPQDLAFDEKISSLRPEDRAFELGGEIARAFSSRNPNKLMLLAGGKTETEALEKAAELVDGCRDLQERGMLLGYSSVMKFLPPPSAQRKNLEILRQIDFLAAGKTFREALDEYGLDPSGFKFSLDLLERHAQLVKTGEIILPSSYDDTVLGKWAKREVTRRRRILDLRNPLPANLPATLKLAKPAVTLGDKEIYPAEKELNREELAALWNTDLPYDDRVKRATVYDHGWTVKINIYPPMLEESKTADLKITPLWLAAVRQRLGLEEDDGKSGEAGKAYLTGTALLAHELAGVVKDDFFRVSCWIFGVAALVLAAFFYRHPLRVLYCLLPIVLGLIYLFGIMAFAQINFNFINVLAVPIIIGLGVDNGIHLVNRFYQSGRQLFPVIADTGRAIMITTLTSMVGFGSLAVGGYQGITSMGVLSIIALASSLVASLVVFPAILGIFSPPEEIPADPQADQD